MIGTFSSLRPRFIGVMLAGCAVFSAAVLVVADTESQAALHGRTVSATEAQIAAHAELVAERVLVDDEVGLRSMLARVVETNPDWNALELRRPGRAPVTAARGPAGVQVREDTVSPEGFAVSAGILDGRPGVLVAWVSSLPDRAAAQAETERLLGLLIALSAGGIGAAALMGRWLTAPLVLMADRVRELGGGRLDVDFPVPPGEGEVTILALALRDAIMKLGEARAREAAHLRGLAEVEKLAALGRLAAGVAHEVANPLAGVAGCLRRLGDPELPPERRRRYAETALEGVERSSRVLRDLLDFARPTAAGPEPTSVAVVVGQAVAMARARKDLAPPTLDAPDLDVSWPRLRVEQILLNLLLNAWRAARERVEIRWHAQEDRVRVEIRDDGPGVAPEIASRIFEPFVTTSEPGQGTGLGLAVARAMARGMGGEVGLDREETPDGAWTVAWLELPARVAVEVPVAP